MKCKMFISFAIAAALTVGSAVAAFAVDSVDSTPMTRGSSHRQNVLVVDAGEYYEIMTGCGPVLKNERVVIPLSSFMVCMDYKIVSEDGAGSIVLSNGNREITLTVDSAEAVVDGSSVRLNEAIISENDEIYIDAEDLEQLFSYDIAYDDTNNNIVLTVRDDTPKPVKVILPPEDTDMEQPRTVRVFVGDELKIEVDDRPVIFEDAMPFIASSDRTQVPIRALAEMMNCRVEWNQQTQEVTVTDTDGTDIKIKIGSNMLTAGEQEIEMDTEAVVIENRAYLPLRFVSDAMGLNVFWEYLE